MGANVRKLWVNLLETLPSVSKYAKSNAAIEREQ